MKRYINSILYGALALAAGYLAFFVTGMVCHWIYEALIEWFPTVFRDYSPVLEADQFNLASNIVSMTGAALAVFITNFLVTRYDNERDEYIIRKTEGFYRISEVLPTYYKRYTLPDLVSSLISALFISALLVPAWLYVPKEVSFFSNTVKNFRSFHIGLYYDKWGFLPAGLFVLAITFLSKMLAGIFGLKRWRAAWLTYN